MFYNYMKALSNIENSMNGIFEDNLNKEQRDLVVKIVDTQLQDLKIPFYRIFAKRKHSELIGKWNKLKNKI